MIYGPEHFYNDSDYRSVTGRYKTEWLKPKPDAKPRRPLPVVAPPPARKLDPIDPFFLHKLLDMVAYEFRVPAREVRSECRRRELADARQVFFWLARIYSDASYPAIGRVCGGRDHSTVIHGCRKIEAMDGFFKPQIDRIVARIEQEE